MLKLFAAHLLAARVLLIHTERKKLPMTQLLVVETSPRGGQSVSRQMTQRFLTAWRTANPGGHVVHRDLVDSGLSFVPGGHSKCSTYGHPNCSTLATVI